jgi:hypothetical protein
MQKKKCFVDLVHDLYYDTEQNKKESVKARAKKVFDVIRSKYAVALGTGTLIQPFQFIKLYF